MFDVQVRSVGGALIVDLAGALGREGGEQILQVVQGQPAVPRRLVLNFARVSTLNTAGLGGVLWAVRVVTKAGNQAFAFGLTDHFRKVFHVMGLTHYIALVADEASSLGEGETQG
jgi:anti-anti-sigma factor